jgi:hypothetical protein
MCHFFLILASAPCRKQNNFQIENVFRNILINTKLADGERTKKIHFCFNLAKYLCSIKRHLLPNGYLLPLLRFEVVLEFIATFCT